MEIVHFPARLYQANCPRRWSKCNICPLRNSTKYNLHVLSISYSVPTLDSACDIITANSYKIQGLVQRPPSPGCCSCLRQTPNLCHSPTSNTWFGPIFLPAIPIDLSFSLACAVCYLLCWVLRTDSKLKGFCLQQTYTHIHQVNKPLLDSLKHVEIWQNKQPYIRWMWFWRMNHVYV